MTAALTLGANLKVKRRSQAGYRAVCRWTEYNRIKRSLSFQIAWINDLMDRRVWQKAPFAETGFRLFFGGAARGAGFGKVSRPVIEL